MSDTPTGPRRYTTVSDAAKYVCVTTKTIYQWIGDGVITGYRFGPKIVRVDLNELDRMAVSS